MFKKLVTNLPFNSSLINQVGFYADRLRQEKSIRRLSFVFMALALSVQSLAILAPPERSLAYSTNHIINGVQTRDDILSAYDKNTNGVRDIYDRFYISRADIASLSTRPNATIRSNDGNNYRTIGRSSLWNYSKVASRYKKTQAEVKHKSGSVYNRELRAWDIVNSYNTYSAFKGKNTTTGQTFWILKDCGNITWVPPYDQPPTPTPTPPPTPEVKKPVLEIKKSIVEKIDTLKPGDTYTYRIQYRNKVVGSTAENVVIQDQLDISSFSVVSVTSKHKTNQTTLGNLTINVGDLRGTTTYQEALVKVKLKKPLPANRNVCNGSSLKASNAATVETKRDICVDVIIPCDFDPTVPSNDDPNCVAPVAVCKVVDAAVNRTTRKVTYKTTATSSNPSTTTVKNYSYNFGDGSPVVVNPATGFMDSTMHTYAPGEYEAKVTVTYTATGVTGDQKAECSAPIDFEEDGTLGQSKSVSNLTQNLEGAAALESKVKAGDKLRYTLSTVNSQNYERVDITVEDYIGDVLDYATLDMAALEAEGGRFDEEQNKVIWEDVKIPANSQVELNFEVTMLDPIPATNRPSTTSGDFDCVIDNTYGDIVSMSVQCPAVKGIESLPNTGPGASLVAVMGITLGVGYFFARARLMSKEINIIRTDYAVTGGM